MFYGWKVVACAFTVAVFGWGLGFYGIGVYLAFLSERHGWAVSAIGGAITFYYLGGATVIMFIGGWFDRWGSRVIVVPGVMAMAAGVSLLPAVSAPWQLYPVFAVMAFGWAAMSAAAINAIVAPWFERRRGLAISIAMNGASTGGIVVAPVLIFLIQSLGFGPSLHVAAAAMLVLLIPLILLVLRNRPADLGLLPDGAPVARGGAGPGPPAALPVPPLWSRSVLLRSGAFWSISVAFALALAAQVGFVTHQVAFLKPLVGNNGAALAVGMVATAAIVGRLLTGLVVDRVDRRLAAAVTFLLQAATLSALIARPSPVSALLFCTLFGLGIGNVNSLPGLVVQVEFPKEHFNKVVALVISINYFTIAFSPGLLGWLREREGSYEMAFGVCIAAEVLAALIVLAGRRFRGR